MELNRASKTFMEIPPKEGCSSISSGNSDTLGDFSSFKSSDGSFNSTSSRSLNRNNEEKSFDSSDNENQSSENYTETTSNSYTKKESHKSFEPIIKFFKRFSTKSKTSSSHQQSILRQPTEYRFVKGISGVPCRIRIAKASSLPTNSRGHDFVTKH